MIAEVPVSHAPRERGQSCHDFRKLWHLFVKVNRYFLDLRKQRQEPIALPSSQKSNRAA
jgi:hypothetical protein